MLSLNSYLSQEKLNEFVEWYSNEPVFADIRTHLDNLISLYKDENILDYNKKLTIKNTIELLLKKEFHIYFKDTPDNIFDQWTINISIHCFQGGYGYGISYMNSPHHYCIKINSYETVKNIPHNVNLANILLNKYLNISEIPTFETWAS
jgi:hypothetical protein